MSAAQASDGPRGQGCSKRLGRVSARGGEQQEEGSTDLGRTDAIVTPINVEALPPAAQPKKKDVRESAKNKNATGTCTTEGRVNKDRG